MCVSDCAKKCRREEKTETLSDPEQHECQMIYDAKDETSLVAARI